MSVQVKVQESLAKYDAFLAEITQNRPTLPKNLQEQLAFELVKREMDGFAVSDAAKSTRTYSKYTSDEAPETYLAKFEGEAKLQNLPEAQMLQVFPSLMSGKATPAVPFLQDAGTWGDMKKAFTEYFEVDEHVVLAELQALQCERYDV